MSLYNTYVDFVGDGTTTDFAIPFPYIDTTDVVVTVNGAALTVDTDYTFPNPNTVRITIAPASGASVEVARSTDIAAARVVFSNGSSTTAQQFNKAVTQLLYGMQEAVDRASVGQANAAAAKAEADTALATANTANTSADSAVLTATNAQTTATAAGDAAAAAQTAAETAQAAAEAASAAASVHNAAELPYDNSASGLSATTAQQAIDLIAGATGLTTLTSSTIDNVSTVTGAKITDALNTLKALIAALAPVAASGAYADLTGRPSLATVATSGAYADLTGKPTIPAAQVNSDWNAITGVSQILNKPSIPAAQVNSDWNAVSGVSAILNKPNIITSAVVALRAVFAGDLIEAGASGSGDNFGTSAVITSHWKDTDGFLNFRYRTHQYQLSNGSWFNFG
jgi:hypothetical protein